MSEEDRNLEESMEEEHGIELGQDEDEEEDVFTVQVGATYSCQRKDGTYHDAEVVKTRINKRAGREEFYVHYIGLNCRQNEWVDKTRLLLVKQEEEEEEEEEEEGEEEAAANEALQETSGSENQSVKLEDDEPEAKRIKVDPPGNSSVRVSDDLAEELTCPLCNELFKEPVVVKCGHNFCCGCLDKAWAGQDSFTCPACKEVINDKKFTNNRALANLVKKTAGAFAVPAAVLTPAKSVAKEKPPVNCLVHDEKLKLFCKDDGDLSCVICRDSLKHTCHSFLPIMDAVCVYKTELSSIVTPLEDALKVAEQMAKNQNEKIGRHKTTMTEFREHIESEFQKMYKFLKEKEQKLLEKLQEEGESLLMEMEDNIAKIEENIKCIKQSIATTSEKLNDTDSVSFLTDIKMLLKKCQDQQKEALSFENTLIDRELNKETYKAQIQFPKFEEVRTTKDVPSAVPSTVPSTVKKPKEIWIIGNYWVNLAAKRPTYGRNLGFEEEQFVVRWMDRTIMCWRDLTKELDRTIPILGEPNVLFVHLGSSDLGMEKFQKLISIMKRDLRFIIKQHPNMVLIWSAILPRREWLRTHLERQRKQFNTSIYTFANKHGFQVAQFQESERICKDHLYNKGKYLMEDLCNVLNKNLKEAIDKAITTLKEKTEG